MELDSAPKSLLLFLYCGEPILTGGNGEEGGEREGDRFKSLLIRQFHPVSSGKWEEEEEEEAIS